MAEPIFKPTTSEAAAGTNVGAASTAGDSEFVRLYNSAAVGTEYLVTVANSANATVGTFSLEGGASAIIQKKSDDKVFAANAAVKFCGAAVYRN